MERTRKNVVVALSSSVKEFADEREKLGAFIEHLNRIIYRRRGVFLDWRVCEDEGRSIRYEPRQDEFDDDIRECRYLLVLIGRRFGEFTEHEFYLALELFEASKDHPDAKQRGIPKIYPFFTSIPEEEREPRARAFRRKLETEIHGGQLTTSFPVEQLDTLKLYILEEFGRDPVLWGRVTVEDGQARVDGQPVMSVENVPLYANHTKLKRLKRQRAALDTEFAELSVEYHAGDREAGVERIRVDRRRRELSDAIHEIEEETLKMFQQLLELSKERQTARAEAAARLLSEGKYAQARAVLQRIDSPEVQADWKRERQTADMGLDGLRVLIQENRLRIQAIRADGISPENLPELTECYKINAETAQTYHIEPQAVYDYARFLQDEHKYPLAIKLCEWLEAHYQQTDAPSETWAELYNLLGICHMENRNFRKGETYYRDALARYRALAETDPETHIPNVAMTCNNLAALLADAGRHAEAEPLYREALDIRRNLAEAYPDAFNQDVAMTCNNLAALLNDTGRYAEAEPLYREALDIRRKLAEAYPDAFNPVLANTCFNLGVFELQSRNNPATAKKYFEEALSLYERIPYHAQDAAETREILELLSQYF